MDEFLVSLYDQFETLTSEEALTLWGEPDAISGSGLLIYQYKLADGVTLWLGFPGSEPLAYAQLESSTGQRFALMPMEAEGAGENAITPTPAFVFTATPLPTVAPSGTDPTLVPTGTPLPSQ